MATSSVASLRVVETPADRRVLASDAGLPRLSLPSVLAGALAGFGLYALLVSIAVAVVRGLDISTTYTPAQWRNIAIAGAVVGALLLFGSYLYGGYVAGRMARRSGMLQGLGVFVLGLLLVGAVIGMTALFTSTRGVTTSLRSTGIPTSMREWGRIGMFSGIGSLLAMLLGAVIGGRLGDGWHSKLVARALDPEIGPDVDLRDRFDTDHNSVLARQDDPSRPVAPVTSGQFEAIPAEEPTGAVDVSDRPGQAPDTWGVPAGDRMEQPAPTPSEYVTGRQDALASPAPSASDRS